MYSFMFDPWFRTPTDRIAEFGKKVSFVAKYGGKNHTLAVWREGIPGCGTVVFEILDAEKRQTISMDAKDIPALIKRLQELANVFEREVTDDAKQKQIAATASKLSRIEAILRE